MKKTDLFELEENAHLSINELRTNKSKLVKSLDERLEKRAHRKVVARLGGGSEKLRKLVAGIKIPVDKEPEKLKLREATLKALRDAAKKDKQLAGDAELAKELDELEKAAAAPASPGTKPDATLADSLRLGEPIAFHPEFRKELDAAKLFRLSDATGLGDKTAELLISEIGKPTEITESQLERLVKDKKLNQQEAAAAGIAASLYNILDERPELVATAKAGIGEVRDLAKLDKAAWTKVVKDSKTKPPGGIAAEAYAELLERKVKRLFPTDALSARFSKVKVAEAIKRNSELDTLRKLNPGIKLVAKQDFASLKTDGLSDAEVKKLRTAFAETVSVANRFSGMKVAEVLEDPNLSDAKREAEVKRRVALVDKFFADNEDVLGADLAPGSKDTKALKFDGGASGPDKAMVLATARTYQRALTVTDDITDAESLVGGGYPSALSIAMSRPKKIAERTGLKAEVAVRYQDKAKGIATAVTAHAGTIIDLLGGLFVDTAVGNVSTEIAGYLKEVPGFADFFGNQSFCNCKHCQSILGPAAYFVDLMCFVDENITQEFFADKPDHPLNLKNRRPDLWTLELTCENTNTPIPHLVVINEILENAVAKDTGYAGDFGDRVAVGTKVYRDTLPDQVDSFRQPLHLPFEELRTFIRHFERSLADLAEAGSASGDALARLRLGLPPKDFELITSQTNNGRPFLRRVYGIQFTEAGGTIEKFDAQLLLKPMGVSRHELSELVATRYVTAKGAVNIRIVGEKRTSDSIQNDIENISGLTRAALDRMHRFVRLWRATGWRIGELDLVLTHIEAAALGGSLDAPAVRAVAAVHRLQTSEELSVEDSVALWSAVPRHPVLRSVPPPAGGDDDAPSVYPAPISPLTRLTVPLFDRLFNQKSFVEADGTYPKPGTNFLHPALAGAPPANTDPNLHRLLASLGATEDELLQLILGLARPLGIDPTSNTDADKAFALSERNLGLLYRHARLAKLLRLTVPELFALAAMADALPNSHPETLADVEALLKLKAWADSTDWTLPELARIRRPAHAAVLTSQAAVVGSAGGEAVTYSATSNGVPQAAETVTLVANADLDAVVTDWNGQAQHTVAYRSDELGVARAAGDRLSVRTKDTGPFARLEVSADSLPLFTGAPPATEVGGPLASPLPQPEVPNANELAQALVEQVAEAESLVFSNTVFALLPATSPVATSAAPVPNTAGGEAVTYTVTLAGEAKAPETITLAANADLDAVVDDWNGKATLTRAYRSDATGKALDTGTHLSLTVQTGSGSSTKINVTASAAALFLVAESKGAEVTETQSQEVFAANAALFESVDAQGRFRLKTGFNPAAPLAMPASVDAALGPALLDLLAGFHSKRLLPSLLPTRVNVEAALLPPLVTMLGVDPGQDSLYRELRGDLAPTGIAALIEGLRRLGVLFKDSTAFNQESLEFIAQESALFGIADFHDLNTESVRNIETFRALLAPWALRDEPAPDLHELIGNFAPLFAGADLADLAALLGCEEGLLQSLTANITLAAEPFTALRQLGIAVPLAQHIGIGGSAIKLVQSTNYAELATASAAVQAGFRAKYQDESEWEKKVEPFRDALLSRRRDGLVAYLVHSGAPQFDEVSDLYHYYLLDVELEGCARTSRVASAIDSVQLYVHRCLMNLEETLPGDANPVHVLPESVPAEEWEWRQNYRVWEANRKIFLYPENYIEPELRDNKTPLFKQLEEELLSKEITDEAILEAYARYLRGFDELAHLSIAGSYHEKDDDSQRDVLHFFGVTADDPPTYYYRRVENAHYGANSDERSTHWGPWEKVDAPIPARKIAPVVHHGQLYAFWVRYVTKSRTEVKGGNSSFVGYEHRAKIEYARRKLDGSWTAPQTLSLETSPFGPDNFPTWYQEAGLILDPIVPKDTLIENLPFIGTIYKDYEPLYDDRPHVVPREDYSLRGFGWDQVFPAPGREEMSIRAANFQLWSPIDLFRKRIGPRYEYEDPADYGVPWLNPGIWVLIWILTGGEFDLTDLLPSRLVWSRKSGDQRRIYTSGSVLPCFDTYSFASLVLEEERFRAYEEKLAEQGLAAWKEPQWSDDVIDHLESLLEENLVVAAPADVTLDTVNGSVGDVIIQTSRDAFYLQNDVRSDGKYELRRLNTSLSEDIASILFNRGLEELLATRTQLALKEHPTGLNLQSAEVSDSTGTGDVDFSGSMGAYLREIFFHIPFLIADHLNSQGRFEDAQRWYHYVFDPTASETIQGLPGGLSDEERRRRELDRNWRYREFRGLTLESLRAQLTNERAIDEYRREPFNPHAVARLRLTAYQKAIVMKYVDNLLDWGDDLFVRAFAQLNPEYLRQATLKYVTAREILGERPAELGDCGEGKLSPKVFPKIKDALLDGSEFLMEMESVIAIRYRLSSTSKLKKKLVAIEADRGARELAVGYEGAAVAIAAPAAVADVSRATPAAISKLVAGAPAATKEAATRVTKADVIALKQKDKKHGVTLRKAYAEFLNPKVKWVPDWGISFVREISPIFCVPGNRRMLAHWDRVEDRLYKLRHCMDIEGVPRQLPLFAPPIDPGLLVGGRAAGLSLDDILAATAGTLPPYRFRYLVDKARSYAATVQAFGAALLGALEKRDAEELARLRDSHQRNILALSTEVKRNELKIAEEGATIARRRQEAAQYRHDYYDGLIAAGLNAGEITQTAARVTSSVLRTGAAVFDILASIAHLVPQVGSPFAMKYGGLELGSSASSWSEVANKGASISDAVATIAGIVAGFERREQGWEHQRKLAENDLKTIEKELVIAELRKAMASRGLELHEKAKEQHDEVIDYFEEKFSNLGLYTHLSRTLQQLHRDAYNNALAIARLAEQAYRFERPGDNAIFVGGEWDASRSGLLAGERLNLALQNMEKRFIETNSRSAEINQSFSLAQINPQALIDLKEIGACEFELPEFFFDMFYPGQYRRRIRAVRLTIPCITGPYTNVSAKLTLVRSHIRRDAVLGAPSLLEVPPSGTTTVATSTAQGDAGVFELSFRDERYMPFEGAGAVSSWRLELPSQFRPFDYQSINDVILNVSYTAEEDGVLRQDVESQNAAIAGSLLHYLNNNSLTRVFSLRQEFSSAFNRLMQAAVGTPVTFELNERHFPLFLQGRGVNATAAHVVLAVEDRAAGVGTTSVSVNGTSAAGFPAPTNPPAAGDPFGGLPNKAINAAFAGGLKKQHSLTVDDAGNLAAAGGAAGLDPDKLRDIMLVVQYRI